MAHDEPTPPATSPTKEPPPLPIPKGKEELIWEQWKYRHEFFWKAFYIVFLTTAFISTVPLFKSNILTGLGVAALVFPLFGLICGIYGRILLDAEYQRLRVVNRAYTTSPWVHGIPNKPPYRTDAGNPIIELLKPAMQVGLIWIPILAYFVVAYELQYPPPLTPTNACPSNDTGSLPPAAPVRSAHPLPDPRSSGPPPRF